MWMHACTHTHTHTRIHHIKALRVFPKLLRKPTGSCSLRMYYMHPYHAATYVRMYVHTYICNTVVHTVHPSLRYSIRVWVCVCGAARLWQVPLSNEEVNCQQLHSPRS